MTTLATAHHPHPTAGPPGDHSDDADAAAGPGRTWTVTTTSGLAITGYLPPWAQDDPSRTGVPVERLGKVLADICHWAEFPGQVMRVACDGGPGADSVVFGGSIECHPYTEDHTAPIPAASLPVVHLQVVDDWWVHDLDPDALATITAKLRAQVDYLEREVHPRLVAARADWAAHRTA